MKYFTRGWIHGQTTDEKAAFVTAAYWQHVHGLELPPAVRDLAFLNPHDAYVLDVEHEPQSAQLRLRLRCGDMQVGYFDARMTFRGVTIASAHAEILTKAKRPATAEILYDEVDRSDFGGFEYRILLFPDGEIAFQFENVEIIRDPVADRTTG